MSNMTAGNMSSLFVSTDPSDALIPDTSITPVSGDAPSADPNTTQPSFQVQEIPASERPYNSPLRWRIVGPNGTVVGSLRSLRADAEAKLAEINDCSLCRDRALGIVGAPPHRGSNGCPDHCGCVECIGEAR